MIRKIAAGMAFGTLALLAGCVDKYDLQCLQDTDKSMSEEVSRMNRRLQAVEAACLQLNEKIGALESRAEQKGGPSENAVIAPAAESQETTAATDSKPLKLTLGSFSYTISGMKPESIEKMFGKPVKVKKVAKTETWFYNQINLQKADGSPDPRPAMIVFENGRVARGILTQDVQYDSQLEQPPQPADTNAAAEQKQ